MSTLAEIAPRLARAQEQEREERRLDRLADLEVKLARARDALELMLVRVPSYERWEIWKLASRVHSETRVR
jgi:predicted nucleotidyltransferase